MGSCHSVDDSFCGGCSSVQYCVKCSDDTTSTPSFECRTELNRAFVTEVLPSVLAVFAVVLLLLIIYRRRISDNWNNVYAGTSCGTRCVPVCGGVCLILPFVILLLAGGILSGTCSDGDSVFQGCWLAFVYFCVIPALICFGGAVICLTMTACHVKSLPSQQTTNQEILPGQYVITMPPSNMPYKNVENQNS